MRPAVVIERKRNGAEHTAEELEEFVLGYVRDEVADYQMAAWCMDDPHGALALGGTIEEGWVIARLDLRLPTEAPYGRNASTGSVAALLVAPTAEAPLVRVDAADAVAGHGLEGDRYRDARGTFSGSGRGYQLTLVEADALDDMRLNCRASVRSQSSVSPGCLLGRWPH